MVMYGGGCSPGIKRLRYRFFPLGFLCAARLSVKIEGTEERILTMSSLVF